MDDSDANQPNCNLDQIVIALENIERQNLKDDPDTMEWIDRITDPEFNLIESLIEMLILDLKNHSLVTTILKIFIKFIYYNRDKVLIQLQDHPNLLRSLISYVSENDIKVLSAEAFIIIVEVCSKYDYKLVKVI
jgi:hypothetical protein